MCSSDLWLDPSEKDDPNLPKVKIDGEERALRPITINKDIPTKEDIERLKQFCTHSLFMVTFWHWWIHSSQKTWGKNLHLASLAPEKPADLPYGNTKADAAQRQLSISTSLTDFEHPGLIANPHGDIYPYYISELRKYKDPLLRLGLNVSELPYGIII